jgi:hypothetical protein
MRWKVEIVGKFVLQGHDAIAWFPGNPRHNHSQRGAGLRYESDVFGVAMHQAGYAGPDAVGIVKPGQKIVTRSLIAMCEVRHNCLSRAPGKLAEGGSIQECPVGESREL